MHLLLDWVVTTSISKVLSWWDHSHLDILLVCSLYLLLLLLKQFDLLLDCQLFHCRNVVSSEVVDKDDEHTSDHRIEHH